MLKTNKILVYIFMMEIFGNLRLLSCCRCTPDSFDVNVCICYNVTLVNNRSVEVLDLNKNMNKIIFKTSNFSNTLIFDEKTVIPYIQSVEFINCSFDQIQQGALNKSISELSVTHANKFDLKPLAIWGTLQEFSLLDLKAYPSVDEIKEFFKKHSNLKKISLNKIYLNKIDKKFFDSLQVLNELHLNETYVNVSSLSGLPKLEKVDLTYNAINELPSDFLDGAKNSLTQLDLTGNSLEKIDDFDFNKFTRLVNLTLPYDGVYSCSWLKENNKLSKDVNCLNASSSEEESGHKHNKSLMVIAIIFFCIMLALLLFCAVKKFCLSRRTRSSQDPKSARYSAVYRTTVEPTNPST